MAKYDLSFHPTNLDILYDESRGTYVQRMAGINATDDPDATTICKSLIDESAIDYKMSEFDIIQDDQGLASQVLSPELQKRVHRIDEGVCITGRIIRRTD